MENFLVEWQHTKSKHSFTVLTELQVYGLELFILFSINGLVLSLVQHSSTILPDLLRSTLHISNIVVIWTFLSNNGKGVLVSGVEWHF
jgi:hypothetical protein